ncbi:MAG: hypothetical protein IV100_05385 [Myxococcales bacterium]|nr:hypothetical protein [Myxococcales bacterium]
MDAGRVLFAGGNPPAALQTWAIASGRVLDITHAGTAGLEHFLAHPAGLVLAVIHMETMGDLAALARLRELPAGRNVPLIVLSRPSEVERIACFAEQLKPLAVLPEPLDIARLSELHPAKFRPAPMDAPLEEPAPEVSVRPRAQRGMAASPPEDTRALRSAVPTAEPEIDISGGRRSRVPVSDDVVVRRRPAIQPDLDDSGARSTRPALSTRESVLTPPARTTRGAAPVAPAGLPADELRTRMRDLGKQNHFERLGLSMTATQYEVDAAFEGLSARLQPECYRDPNDLAMAECLMKAFRLAYDTLHSPHKRAEYASRLQAPRLRPTEPVRTTLSAAFSDLLAEAERASEAVLVHAPSPRVEATGPTVTALEPSPAVDTTPLIEPEAPPPLREPEVPAIPPDPAGSSILTFLRPAKVAGDGTTPAPTSSEPAPPVDSVAAPVPAHAAPIGAAPSADPGELPSFDDVDAIFGGDLDWSGALPQSSPDTTPVPASARPAPTEGVADVGHGTPAPGTMEVAPTSDLRQNRADRLAPKPLDRTRKTPQEALEAGPRDWIVEARYLLFIGDYARSISLLDACLAAEPNIRRYHYYRGLALGRVHAESGRFAEARKAFDDALRHAGSGQTEAAQALQELAQLERRRA